MDQLNHSYDVCSSSVTSRLKLECVRAHHRHGGAVQQPCSSIVFYSVQYDHHTASTIRPDPVQSFIIKAY